MKLCASPKQIEHEIRRLIRQCRSLRWSVAWASFGFSLYDHLVKRSSKIEQLTVGTHFYQTHPDFIEHFHDVDGVTFVMKPNGVFHPKLYFFEFDDDRWECIVGSPNFTRAAMSSNTECAVLFTSNDADSEAARSDITTFLDASRSEGQQLSISDVEAYRSLWKVQQERLERLSGNYVPADKRTTKAKSPIDLAVFTESWGEYFKNATSETSDMTLQRLQVLEEARRLFRTHGEFSNIAAEGRKGIAGFKRTESLDWLWFGNMLPRGTFTSAVNRNEVRISDALAEIPLIGDITESHFDNFVAKFKEAFEGTGVATGTRLLCMKRPDYFVCLTVANRTALCEDFGISKSLRLSEVWRLVTRRLMDSVWWNSPEPEDGLEKRIWRCRAAFLDVRFYDPESKN